METLPRLKNTHVVISKNRSSLSDYEYNMLCERKFREMGGLICKMIAFPSSFFFNDWVYSLKKIIYQMHSFTNKGMGNDREREKSFVNNNYASYGEKTYAYILICCHGIQDEDDERLNEGGVTVNPEKFDEENDNCLTILFEDIAGLTSLKIADLLDEIDRVVDNFAYVVRKEEGK